MIKRGTLRRIGLVLVGTGVVVLAATMFGPIDGGAIGVTWCYPLVGPVQRFNPDLPDSLLQRVRVHEQVHADQCRRDGAIKHFLRRLSTMQRVQSEAEGDCAEVKYGVANGRPARLLYAGALDELREAPWFHRVSTAALAEALARQCPSLARLAARDEADWQERLRLQHPGR